MFLEENIFYFIKDNISNSYLNNFMVYVSDVFELSIPWLFVGIVMLFFKKYRKNGIILILSLIFSYFIGNILIKNIVHRLRPFYTLPDLNLITKTPKGFSFPSVHTMMSFSAAQAIFKTSKILGIFSFFIATLVGISRIYLFTHWFTDVLGGIILGVFCTNIINKFFAKLKF
ncbi:MAG: phosphatase PAP2 family protein [Candidatus Paraimprobicoccus trichonymphae]|uniref:Phosphatase PAP2 family protein n=1 Tax=Candidatus Paraimprobicoccus trichonymphae TaxID=3033793 RepID=A0AA48I0C2_9FIRM|nr:MAG: phosphatase PAP2 family protein [Candidatus Paraimprobicoccus trichonymphae]